MEISLIIITNYPDAVWDMQDNNYETLVWHGPGEKPTLEEFESQWPEVSYKWESQKIEDDRRRAYSKVSDPIFFSWQRGENSEQDWLDTVQVIKDANPYPTKPGTEPVE